MPPKTKKSGGIMSRMGEKFYKAVETIIDKKLLNGTARERVSVEKITNLIIRHDRWPEIAEKIIKADAEEVKKYGNG